MCVCDVHYVVYRHSVSGTDEQLCCNLPALFSCSCTFISEVTSAIQMLMVETPHMTPSTRNTFHVMEHIAHDLTTCSISARRLAQYFLFLQEQLKGIIISNP